MALEIFETGSADYGQFMKVLICGAPGAGKTLISSTFPDPFYAAAEGGLMSVAKRHVKGTHLTTTNDLRELRRMLDQDPDVREKMFGFPIKTLVLDTIDEIQRLFIHERTTSKKIESMDMQSWGWLGDQMRLVLRTLRNLDMHVVFTCHLKEVQDQESGRLFVKPALQGAVGDEIAQYMDLALLLRTELRTKVVGKETERYEYRYLQTYKDPQHNWIKDRSGQLPAEIEVNFIDDYDRMRKAIFDDVSGVLEQAATRTVGALEQIAADTAPSEAGVPEKTAQTPVEALQEAATGRQSPAEVVEPDPEPDETPEASPSGAEETATVSDTPIPSPEPKPKDYDDAGPWLCEECGTKIEDFDQMELSKIMAKRILCRPDYRAHMDAGKKK